MQEMIINLNIGLLGHVDSGKTTLARALSTVSSTAAFDKHPQSQERGITVDLGFSALTVDVPDRFKEQYPGGKFQYTFVDCPGHASLIRTIIGGAQIIDLMILVIDIQKGIQTQTAECLVIGEITCKTLIVAINKIDMLEENQALAAINEIKKKVGKVLRFTSYQGDVPMYAISALKRTNISELIEGLQENVSMPDRCGKEPLIFSVDHCFAIKGQGTVCTGTILQGQVAVNDTIEIPITKECKKVKSIQMFRKPVETAMQGDRIGLCITQFNANLMERGIISKPGHVNHIFAAIVPLRRVRYYRNPIKSNEKFHISIGHETVMGKITIFGSSDLSEFCTAREFAFIDEAAAESSEMNLFALAEFELPVLATSNALIIFSKLDMDVNTNACRIAFWGNIVWSTGTSAYSEQVLPTLKIYKLKRKQGSVQRVLNENELIIQNIFQKEAKKDLYIGKKVSLETEEAEEGIIESTFGQTTKLRVKFASALSQNTLSTLKKKPSDVKVLLKFKRYLFNKSKDIIQYVKCVIITDKWSLPARTVVY